MAPENRTLAAITKELVEHPYFPLMFIGEFFKQLVTVGVLWTAIKGEFAIAVALVGAYGILAVLSVLIWVLSDAVSIDVDEEKIIGDGGEEKK